ncbi:MAG: hypothetical protein ACKOW9_02680 [Candidatus Paceibacterota bacterium]
MAYTNSSSLGTVHIVSYPYSFRGFLDAVTVAFASRYFQINGAVQSNYLYCSGSSNSNLARNYEVIAPQTSVYNFTLQSQPLDSIHEIWLDQGKSNEEHLVSNPKLEPYHAGVHYKLSTFDGDSIRLLVLPPSRLAYLHAELYGPSGQEYIRTRVNYSIATTTNVKMESNLFIDRNTYYFGRPSPYRMISNTSGCIAGCGKFDVWGYEILEQLVPELDQYTLMKNIHVDSMRSILLNSLNK